MSTNMAGPETGGDPEADSRASETFETTPSAEAGLHETWAATVRAMHTYERAVITKVAELIPAAASVIFTASEDPRERFDYRITLHDGRELVDGDLAERSTDRDRPESERAAYGEVFELLARLSEIIGPVFGYYDDRTYMVTPASSCNVLTGARALSGAPVCPPRQSTVDPMSAYVVDKAHIDGLVAVAVQLASAHAKHYSSPLSVTHDGEELVLAAASADVFGQRLVDELVASVSFRYPDDDVQAGELPGPSMPYYLAPYAFEPTRRFELAEIVRLVGCYEHQSSKHPEWETSWSHAYCRLVENVVLLLVAHSMPTPYSWGEHEVREPAAPGAGGVPCESCSADHVPAHPEFCADRTRPRAA